jgi:hypothetical protein
MVVETLMVGHYTPSEYAEGIVGFPEARALRAEILAQRGGGSLP